MDVWKKGLIDERMDGWMVARRVDGHSDGQGNDRKGEWEIINKLTSLLLPRGNKGGGLCIELCLWLVGQMHGRRHLSRRRLRGNPIKSRHEWNMGMSCRDSLTHIKLSCLNTTVFLNKICTCIVIYLLH